MPGGNFQRSVGDPFVDDPGGWSPEGWIPMGQGMFPNNAGYPGQTGFTFYDSVPGDFFAPSNFGGGGGGGSGGGGVTGQPVDYSIYGPGANTAVPGGGPGSSLFGPGAGSGGGGFSLFGPGGSPAANAAIGGGGAGMGFSWWDAAQAALGAYSSYEDARGAERAGRNAGRVDLTTTTSPWGPSEDYRLFGMDWGRRLLEGSGGGGGGGRGGGGGGGTMPMWSPSGRTTGLADQLAERAGGGHPLYDLANSYVGRTLEGEDANPYRQRTFDALEGMEYEPLTRLQDMLFEQLGGGGGGGFGGGGMGFRGGGGGGSAPAPVGAARYAREILEGKYLDEGNPYRSELVDRISDRIRQETMDEALPQIAGAWSGVGRYGSGLFDDAMTSEVGDRMSGQIADVVAQVEADDWNARMGDVMNALGIGAGLDMNAADNAARNYSASASAGASAYSADTQRRIAELGALSDSIGMGLGFEQFGLTGMQALSQTLGADQQFALGMVPDLSGLDMRDLDLAMGRSLDVDRLSFDAYERSAGRRDAAAGRRLQSERYERERPWQEYLMWADALNALSGPYGTVNESGLDARNQSPYAGNPWVQGAAGGLAAWARARGQ